MKAEKTGDVSVYTVAGAETARPLPEWLARRRKRSLKQDAEYQSRIEASEAHHARYPRLRKLTLE